MLEMIPRKHKWDHSSPTGKFLFQYTRIFITFARDLERLVLGLNFVLANLTELLGAILVCCFDLDDIIVNDTLLDGGTHGILGEFRSKLIDVIDNHPQNSSRNMRS